MKKLLLIFNPKAGKTRRAKGLERIVTQLRLDNVFEVTPYSTTARGDATPKAADAAEYDVVVCAGGDGTLNETLNGLMQIEDSLRPLLGYIPCGSTNDTAKTMGIPLRIPAACRFIRSMESQECDVGSINGRNFICTCCFGYGAKASFTTPQDLKNKIGGLAYFLNALKCITDIQSHYVSLTYEGGTIEGDFVFGAVLNTRTVAGLFKLDSTDVWQNDGRFELVLVSKIESVIHLPRMFLKLKRKQYDDKQVFFIQSNNFEFTHNEPVPWLIDGENGGTFHSVSITNMHKSVKLLCPTNEELFLSDNGDDMSSS